MSDDTAGVLLYWSTENTPSGSAASIFAHNAGGFTSAKADVSHLPLPLGAGSPVTYYHGWLMDDEISQSADISQGKGCLAPSATGTISIADGQGLIMSDVLNGYVDMIGIRVWLGDLDAAGNMTPLLQLVVTDYAFQDGAMHWTVKTPAYITNKQLWGIRTATQLDTDPVDPSNPTDPTYLRTSQVSQFGGVAFGDSPASLKCGQALPVETLAYFSQTQQQFGDISTRSNPLAYSVATSAINVADGFETYPCHTEQIKDALGNLTYGGSLTFWCRCNSLIPDAVDETEAIRLIAAINNFIANGYSIVLSDGNWFLDISTYTPWTGTLAISSEVPNPLVAVGTTGNAFGKLSFYPGSTAGNPEYSCVWFNLQDSAGNPLFPQGMDGTQVKIYAVQSSVCISSGQYLLEGLARNQRTVKLNGQSSFDGRIMVLHPGMASPSDFVSIAPVTDIPLTFNAATTGVHAGAFEVNMPVSSGWSFTAVGSLANVVRDSAVGWNGGTDPIHLTLNESLVPGGSLTDYATRLQINLGVLTFDADFLSAEMTFVATLTDSTGAYHQPFSLFIQGPFEKVAPYSAFTNGPAHSVTVANTANRNRTIPNWNSVFTDVESFNGTKSPAMIPWNLNNLELNYDLIIREIFIWAFYKFSFSSIYATVYPFWTQGSCAMLATDGAGNVLAGGQGTSPIAADGSQNWTPLTLPNPSTGGAIRITGSAYGAGVWVSVGRDTPTGGSPTAAAWVYTGGAWQAGAFGTGPQPTRVRFLGTHFVCLFTDGSIRTSTDGITWSAPISTGLSVCYDVAFDGTNYIAFGQAGHLAKSTNLTSWTLVTASAITDLVYGAAWLASGAGGAVYIAVGANGKAYYASQVNALAGTWTLVTLDAAGSSLDAVGVTTSGSNAVVTGQTTTGFKIWSTSDGASYGLMFQDATDSMGGTQGYGSSVVYTPNGWVVGTQQGNILTSTYGGQPAGATWIPWGTPTPNQALTNICSRYFGGLRVDTYDGNVQAWNPVRWTGGKYYVNLQSWAIAFDPPDTTTNTFEGTNADAAARQIAAEWWAFAGEMPATTLDGSSDNIAIAVPELNLGNIEDVATLITVQYQPFGGAYLSTAYIQNVDTAYVTGNDEFYFAGWDGGGSGTGTKGYAIWAACRAAYLATGILRAVALTFDSIQDPDTLGTIWTTTDADLGSRIQWLCGRPQFLKVLVRGNASVGAQAMCAARYKPNFAMVTARGGSALGSTGYGIVNAVTHKYIQAEHTIETAFAP